MWLNLLVDDHPRPINYLKNLKEKEPKKKSCE
jgi:hypothetical protein